MISSGHKIMINLEILWGNNNTHRGRTAADYWNRISSIIPITIYWSSFLILSLVKPLNICVPQATYSGVNSTTTIILNHGVYISKASKCIYSL